MNPSTPAAQSVPNIDSDANAETTASLGNLAHDTSAYVQAWTGLLASETKLAKASIARLALAVLVVPAIALTVLISLDALLVTLLERWIHDFASSIAIVLFLNIAGLFLLLVAMRRWWRNLSLPRSRGALSELLARFV